MKPTNDNQSPINNIPTPTPQPETKPKLVSPNVAISQGLTVFDAIAPQSIEIDFDYFKINDVYFRTIFVGGYPRFVSPGWLEPVVNFDSSLDISFYIYPVDGKSVLDDLRRKIAEMEAEISTDIERGRIVDPSTQAKLEDARSLQEQLVKGIERFYEFSFYITIPASSVEELNHVTKQIESQLGSLLIVSKHAILDQEAGFLSTAPFGMDRLNVTRNMDTTSVATTFPLTSSELSSDRGVLYGINSQNESFIIFDRFSLQNSNMTIFATSGAGKSTSYDTKVLYQNKKGDIKRESIGKLIDTMFKNKKHIKLEKEIDGIVEPGIKVFSFDENLKGVWSNVEIAARKISPKSLYKIITASGRKITITKDHCLVCLKNGKIVATKGESITVGNYIPVPREIKGGQKNINKYQGHIINKELLTLLGLTTSEGHIENDFVTISNTDQEILNLIKNCAKQLNYKISPVYNYPKRTEIRGYSIRGGKFSSFVINNGGGGNSGEKRVPGFVFSLSNRQISTYLKAYFEGDGGVEDHEITATTKSKNLASDLAYLLLRFGIVARIKTRLKAATNTIAKTKRKYYRISISGQDSIKKYINRIGFITERKNQASLKLLKNSNTNTDIIPELQSTFKEIYKDIYDSENPAPKKFSEVKLGSFNPSRNELLNMVLQIKNRIYEIESLEKDGLSKLKALPTIKEIIECGKNKKINALLWKNLNKSWATMRSGIYPNTKNALTAAQITHGYTVEIDEVGRSLYRCFKFTGKSLQKFDSSLWSTTLYKHANARYQKLIKARDFISDAYRIKIAKLKEIKERVICLETLAKSDLYWDPIVKIEKTESKHPYVYDLQVKNEVFLAGYGGLFVHNSYFVKLEALRSLMTGTEAIIIDPESEYKTLADAVGGEYISFSFNAPAKINPFDLAQIREEGENQLGIKILSLHSLMKVIMGVITPTQEAMLDRALIMTYRNKGITMDPDTQGKEPPLMEDLYKTLIGMEVPDALDLAARIEKFVRGSFVGIFDKQTNINITNPFTVFSVKDLQETLRPIAMFIILDYIWTRVKKDIKKRILIVDEAWHMMKYPDTAQFLWSVVKRARKYYLGLTTITQDVEDFLGQDIGKAIVTNSALQVLLKQSPAAIDKIGEVFYLSQGEKNLLLAANVGEGIFFAGPHHAPIRVVASTEEDKLITTKPLEVAKVNPNAYEAK
ncbi:MAG: Type IV secretory pathway VirB4 component-like protein [Candidatus Woesebacteria bacterium GW2011_GWB1_39_10]|uniref:Type IV secretory pathway VirB4 component-like protein n=2 Tax=Candidatus Woeseibacteriota TaxID=1752722 RepID=A0A0G0LMB7_9BACT|nr:MAG: Type IV secretory pathway VirB4 component-like protein [Candidatus Woesebacteria bacterium GW2011_GWB1_39_10]KKS91137.1 MAG: Type IV secretory pathway VirB4 component-like protein [Candidatus Woesebacteria bacterium GW2011_GWA1_43_12]